MSKINKQFLIFKDRLSFESKLANEEIKDTSIVFIAKERLIWTHGIMFGDLGTHAKGYFTSVDKLPEGEEGDWAIVNENGTWYLYYYEDGNWIKGNPYESDDYVLKSNLLDYIKNFYDNVYVRKDEVYTPDQYGDGESGDDNGSGSGSGSGTAGSILTVDTVIDKNSFNPVANYVIYNALKNKLEKSDLDDYMTFEAFELATKDWVSGDLENYYTKEEVEQLISILPQFEIAVVEEKPNDPDPTTMYIIKDGDVYTTWIYKDEWLCLGQQKIEVDLSGYVTNTSLNSKLANKQDKLVSGINIKSITLNGEEKSLLDGGTITVDMRDYATKEYVDSHASQPIVNPGTGETVDLDLYALKSELPDLTNNVTTDNISDYISTFVTQDTVEQIIHDLSTFRIEIIRDGETVENPEENVMYLIYDSEEDVYVQNVYKDGEWYSLGNQTIDIDLSGYIKESDLSSYITTVQLGTILESYYTKVQADARFVNKEDVYTLSSSMEQPNTAQTDVAGYDPHSPASGTGSSQYQPKNIIIDQASYEALTTYESNAIYFVVESTGQWEFGDSFPIILSAEGL